MAGQPFDGAEQEERCPGESKCHMFFGAKAETGRGLDACDGCDLVDTKPGIATEPERDDVDLLVSEVEQLIDDENAGFAIDWTFHDPELYSLVVQWRKAEREIESDRAAWHHLFVKGHFEKK